MICKIALIEDKDGENLRLLVQQLGDGDFEVSLFSPRPDLDLREAMGAEPDLYLVDYELDTVQADESIANYRGTTLAARLRELRPEYPVVLLTRSDLSLWTTDHRTAEASSTFDDILYKDKELRTNRTLAKIKLLSLATDYRKLRECSDRSVSSILGLLNTDKEGTEQARLSNPPGSGWKAVEVAKWIRSTLLRYPGVVYGPIHTATALGISLESFNNSLIRDLLEPAEYQGLFCAGQERWWRHTLFQVANRFGETAETGLSMREGFRNAAERKLGLGLGLAIDEQTGTGPADTVCYCLEIPIRIESSLPYHPDARPRVMDEARVSFKAVRETNDVYEDCLDVVHRELMKKIQLEGYGN